MRRILIAASLLLLVTACAKKPRQLVTDPRIDHVVDYTVKVDDRWEDISELFFADASHAARLAVDNGHTLETGPELGTVIQVRVRPGELDVVQRLAEARDPYNLGADLMHQGGRAREARAAFERALEIAPEFLDARYNLGLALLELGEPAPAVRHLQPVVDARPTDADAHYALGAAFYHQGDFARASSQLEKVLEMNPRFLRARFTLAMSLERLGQTGRAREAWLAYLELDSTSAWAAEARTHLDQLP